ncbi:MAG: WD40 repeat domain-containing protein [Planctomycetota bacterium]|nr:MAG: WD40 repeat domain-containing protein [Planctomycetota bacterium]
MEGRRMRNGKPRSAKREAQSDSQDASRRTLREPLLLTYCANVHPSPDLAGVLAALSGPVAMVRDRVAAGPGPSFPVGIWLSGQAVRDLAAPMAFARLAETLTRERMEIATVNAFPFGDFHARAVKRGVYRPDWKSTERLDYTLAVAGFEQIFMYHLDTGALLGVIDVADFRVESLSFSDDGTALLAAGGLAGKYGSALLFDVETGQKTTEFDKQYDAVLCADLAPGGTLAAVGGANRKVRVFDGFTAERLFEIADHTDWVQAVAFSPDGLYLATGDRAGGLYLWESDTGRRVHELRGHSGAVSALTFQRDSGVLVSVGRDGTMRFWGVEAGNAIRQVAAHGVAALDVVSAVNGRWATSGADGRVRIWNADGGEFRSLEPHGDWVYQVSFSTDGAKLVAGDWTGVVRIYESETGALLNALSTVPPAPARPVALASPVAAGSGGR